MLGVPPTPIRWCNKILLRGFASHGADHSTNLQRIHRSMPDPLHPTHLRCSPTNFAIGLDLHSTNCPDIQDYELLRVLAWLLSLGNTTPRQTHPRRWSILQLVSLSCAFLRPNPIHSHRRKKSLYAVLCSYPYYASSYPLRDTHLSY